jgi:hypothetical protein
VTVTKIVKSEVTVTEFQVNEIHVVKMKMSRTVPMVNFATNPSNVLQDVVQRITFAEPKYQTVTVVKVTGRIVNQDMTIGENVSNVNHIVTAQVDNSVTGMFAELLLIVLATGVDVSETVDTDTEFGLKPEMQVSEATTDVQILVTGRTAIPNGHHVRMAGIVVEMMVVRVDIVTGENANTEWEKDTNAVMTRNVTLDGVITIIVQPQMQKNADGGTAIGVPIIVKKVESRGVTTKDV